MKKINEELSILLREFGPHRRTYHAEYPFWRLQNDKIWEVEAKSPLRSRVSNTDPLKSELVNHFAKGGFTAEVYSYLTSTPNAIKAIATELLEAHFPSSLHEEILNAVGLELHETLYKKTSRDPQFRKLILRAYEYRCAICNWNLRLGDTLVGLEAAHIKWVQAGGPDIIINGITLCSMHHKLFDRGVFTISNDFKILVSQEANGGEGFKEWLLKYHCQNIQLPQSSIYNPSKDYLSWHKKEVFKSPARSL